MMVSIIVPIYNVESYVERCVDSLISQTYTNLEIILVNDGSTDDSGELIRKYEKDSRVIIINKQNGGISDARNTGMKRMTGELVLFVDGDDYLDYDCIQLLISNIQDNIDVVMFPYSKEYRSKSKKSELFDRSELYFYGGEVKEKILGRMIGPRPSIIPVNPATMDRLNTVWGKLYKRNIIEGIKFENTKRIGAEDGLFNIQVFQNVNNVKYTSKTYYHYEKKNETSILHTYIEGLLDKRWRMYAEIKNCLGEKYQTYSVNLSNRIVCEQFGMLSNIVNSDFTKEEKLEMIKEILSDSRYKRHYTKAEIRHFQFPWSVFYTMCMRQRYNEIMFLSELINIMARR